MGLETEGDSRDERIKENELEFLSNSLQVVGREIGSRNSETGYERNKITLFRVNWKITHGLQYYSIHPI